jgi:hypothetical protein
MEVFLAGVLTGSHATRQRYLRQAKTIQHEIAERWQTRTLYDKTTYLNALKKRGSPLLKNLDLG